MRKCLYLVFQISGLKYVYGPLSFPQQSLKFCCFYSSSLIWIQLQNQLMAPLKSCHVWFWLFSESFIYISNIWWPSADILQFSAIALLSTWPWWQITPRISMEGPHEVGEGLTCSVQDPEQVWSRRPPPGNWLVQGGLPGKREKSHSFRAQQTDNRCAGWQQMVTSSRHTERKASFSTFRLLIARRADNFTAKARFALPDIVRQNYILKGDAI